MMYSLAGRRYWVSGIYFYGLLLIGLLLPCCPALAQVGGEVVSALGVVEVLREGHWQAVSGGTVLMAGDTVRTGAGSRAAILLTNGTQIKLNAASRLELKQIAPPPIEGFLSTSAQTLRSILRVLSGEVWVRNSGESLEMQTVPATATIRGTEFNLAVGPNDTARLAVVNGLVEFGNPHGQVLVAANEQADVRVGEAPRKTVLLNPVDAVQWSLYYPDSVGDRVEQPDHYSSSPGYWIQTAQQHLLQGQIPAARQALARALTLDPANADAYSLRSNIELVQNRRTEARLDAERAIAANPSSPVAWLSLSWVQQAEFDLDGALKSARQAVALDAKNPQALIQESRLLFGMDRLREAVKVAKRARQFAPDDAMVNTVWGFLQLAQHRVNPAREAFEAAISQDSTLGLPHLGLGLVLFRHNQTEEAIVEMRKAALLEPLVSLYNSYLGKAFYETQQDQRARKYLEIAQQLDPHDPTPYLYNAIRLQSVNQPVAAVASLQKSIELNDGRGVYRSRLLLDEDLAMRAATLGRTYNEVGFTQLGLQQGWQSLSRDPSNYSAHRLLADSYAILPYRESARVSELLQAQLLQPVSIVPVQPQMAETNLFIPNAGAITPSLYEFTPLFVRDRPTLFASAFGGNQQTYGNELIVSGLMEQSSYSVGQFHYQSDGFRDNGDEEHNIYTLFGQTAITPSFNIQAEYRHRETMSGDLRNLFSGSFHSSKRRAYSQEMARIGGHYALSPQTDVIASVIYSDQGDFLDYPNANVSMGAIDKGTLAETQMIHRTDQFNIVTGFGSLAYDQLFPGFQQPSTTSYQKNAYSYANIKPTDDSIWTVGLSYHSVDSSAIKINEFYPKLGIQWAINDHISLRAAAFKTIASVSATQQTIQPTQVAGFDQFTQYIDATISWNYGTGLDIRFNDQLFGGLELLGRDNDSPFGTRDVPDFYEIQKNHENFYNAYLYWMPSHSWAVATFWQYKDFAVSEGIRPQIFTLIPNQLRTLTLPLNIQYFNPSGFFTGLGVVYVNQRIRYLDPQLLEVSATQSEDFTLVNTSLGYRFPKKGGIASLEIRNLFDKKFHYQDDNYLTGDTSGPVYIPERTLFGRVVINF